MGRLINWLPWVSTFAGDIALAFLQALSKNKDGKWVFYLVSFLSLLPIVFVKVQPAINGTQSLLGFLGISYLTFRSVGIIIELRDGVIKDFTLWEFLRFLLFMPTFQVVQLIALSVLMKIIRPFLSGMS